MATCGKATGARAKMRSRARKEASAQEVRGYYKQFARAKHLEWKSWIDNEIFALVHLRKFKPKNYETGRWVLTIKTDKQGNFLGAKARLVLRGFQDLLDFFFWFCLFFAPRAVFPTIAGRSACSRREVRRCFG